MKSKNQQFCWINFIVWYNQEYSWYSEYCKTLWHRCIRKYKNFHPQFLGYTVIVVDWYYCNRKSGMEFNLVVEGF